MLKRTVEARRGLSGELPEICAILSAEDDSVIHFFDRPVSHTDAVRKAHGLGLSKAQYILKAD